MPTGCLPSVSSNGGGGVPTLMCTVLYHGQSENRKYPPWRAVADVLLHFRWSSAAGRWAGLLLLLRGVAAGVGKPDLLSSRTCRSGRCDRLRFDLPLESTGLNEGR